MVGPFTDKRLIRLGYLKPEDFLKRPILLTWRQATRIIMQGHGFNQRDCETILSPFKCKEPVKSNALFKELGY